MMRIRLRIIHVGVRKEHTNAHTSAIAIFSAHQFIGYRLSRIARASANSNTQNWRRAFARKARRSSSTFTRPHDHYRRAFNNKDKEAKRSFSRTTWRGHEL